jgi:hypothetical protein
MFKKRNDRAEGGIRSLEAGTKGSILGTTARRPSRAGGIRPEGPDIFAKSGHVEAPSRHNDGVMKPRLLFAAPVLLGVWLVSDHGGSRVAPEETGPGAHAASAASRSDPTKTPTAQPEAAREVAPKTARDAAFTETVRPILVSHCAPCHEPGGKMYERLPFDRAETIASHSEGVLRRIKDPEERAAIERWLASQPSS